MVLAIRITRSLAVNFKRFCLCFVHQRSLSRTTQLKKGYKIVFYGTDSFSIQTLKLLHANHLLDCHDERRVVTALDVISKNNSLVCTYAKKNQLPLFDWPHVLPQNMYDLGIVVSFGHLIPAASINACRWGILNVHGSLLPRWRGASPIHNAILAGDSTTGVTVMKIKPEKFDVGEVLSTRSLPLTGDSTTLEVHKTLAAIGAELLMEVLEELDHHLKNAVPQTNSGTTMAPKPKDIDGKINWTTMSSQEVDRKIRALTGLVDVFTYWVDGTELKLCEAINSSQVEEMKLDSLFASPAMVPGSVFFHKRRKLMCVRCADGKWIALSKVALKGKKKMSAMEFYNGFISKQLAKYPNQPIVLLSSNQPDDQDTLIKRTVDS